MFFKKFGESLMIKKTTSFIVLLVTSLFSYANEAALKTEAPPTSKNINPSARPEVVKGSNFYLTADFIYWRIVQDGLLFGTTGVRTERGTTLNGKGSEHNPNFGWAPGFKVGMGYKLPHDDWDLFVKYTWIESCNNHNRATSNNGNLQEGTIIGTLNSQASHISAITEAQSNWSEHFNVIDLELARSFYVSQYLSLRPYGGLKFTWQTQRWRIEYQANDVGIDTFILPGTALSSQDHHTWGTGIRTGMDTNWFFNKNFSLFANTALSGVWTSYDVDREDTFTQNAKPPEKILNVNRTDSSVKAVIEFQLGLQGQWWLSKDTYHIAFSAAFEQQVWINYASYIFLLSDPGSDLTSQGLTVRARLDF